MADVDTISDAELRSKLSEFGYPVGPVTDSTRKILKKKLKEFLSKPVSKNKKSLASFSSGEDEEESHEDPKPKRGSSSMLPPPVNSSRTSKRKTLGPTTIVQQPPSSPESSGKRTSGSKGSRASMSTVYDSGSTSTSFVGTPRPNSRTRGGVTQRYDYETGSDNDEKSSYSTTTRTHTLKTKTTKKTDTPSSFKMYPSSFVSPNTGEESPSTFRILSSLRQEGMRSQVADPSPGSGFRSQFGRRLNESSLRMTPTPSSHNGHFTSQTSTPISRASESIPVVRAPPPNTQSEEHTWFNSTLVSKLLIAVFVVFFAYLAYCYMGMQTPEHTPQLLNGFETDPENKFPLCKDGQMPAVNCVLSTEARSAMTALKSIVPRMTQEAVYSICYNDKRRASRDPAVDPGVMSFKVIEEVLQDKGDRDAENTLANILVLARYNPHWGITVLENGLAIKDPPLPLFCWLRVKAFLVLSAILSIGSLIIAFGTVYFAITSYKKKKALEEKQMFILVTRIIDVLSSKRNEEERANQALSTGTSMTIFSIRDILLPGPDGRRLDPILENAIKYVVENDSRIRKEVQRVAGEEAEVLVWLPDQFVQPETPVMSISMAASSFNAAHSPDTPLSPGNLSQGPETPTRRLRVWQGQAFETMEGSVNSLPYSPTACLKIRHMFNPEVTHRQDLPAEDDEAWPERIRDAILEKCGDGVNILHVSVDKNSTEGCVFVKCATQADAGRAYRALHGSWYDGNLVTVKYLRLERYNERFPDAIDCCIPLRPSNNQKLSLQAHSWQSSLERT